MIEKANVLSLPFFYDCVIEDNTIYFPLANYNALCKGSLLSNQVDIIDTFPDVPVHKRVAYPGICKSGDSLLLFPYLDGDYDILIYNILQHKFIKLPNNKNINYRSNTVFEKNNYIYVVSCMTTEIYKIDLKNNSIQCVVPSECLPDKFLHAEIVRKDDLIFFPLIQKRVFLIFNMQNEEYKYYKFPSNISDVMTLCYHEEELWITGKDRKIYTWNIKEKVAYERAIFPDTVQSFFSGDDRTVWFGHSFIFRDVLWLFPFCANTILKYNIVTGSFEELNISGEEETGLGQERFFTNKYGTVKKCENDVFFLSSKTRILYRLNLITNDIQRHYFYMNNVYSGQIYPTPEKGIMKEENYTKGVEILVENLSGYDNKTIETQENIVGKMVNRYINDEI